jgi:hypothetical protein
MSTSPESPKNPAPPERLLTSDEVKAQVLASRQSKSRLRWFYDAVCRMVKDARDWILYRTVYKYHVVRLDLKPGRYDVDHRMLYACFGLLSEYVELEKPDKWWGWPDNEPIWVEIKDLYDWWKNRRPKRRSPLDDLYEPGPPIADATAMCMSYEDALKKSMDLEKEWDHEDNEMLARLIKIREDLWT